MPSANFRVSQASLARNALANLQGNLRKLGEMQDEASSLKKLRKASDSPIDTVSSLRLRSDIGRNTQISRNLDDASSWLGTADNAMTSVVDQLERVRTLTVQARSASSDPTAREAIANEIDTLRQSIIGLANSRYNDRAVFAGNASGGVAYTAAGVYQGVSASVERTIAPGVRVQVNVNGDEVFGAPGNDLFNALAQLSQAIRTNPAQLDTLAPDLDTRTQQVQSKLGEVGARFARVDTMKNRNVDDALTMKKNLSSVEDADLAQTMMNLNIQQVAYQASLAATARAIQPTLVDFLR
jgi:flagellar hook-associated protein 3 FlgL